MRFFDSEAILLDVVDLHDRDRIVTFLTREWGKKRGVARGARRRYSRFAGQLQPLAKVQVTWFEKEGRELGRITAVDLKRPAHRLQGDLEGVLLGAYLAEHLAVFAQEGEASDLPYRLLDSTLAALLGGADRNLAARYFESWILRLAGIFPPPETCPSCGRPLAEAALAASGEALLCPDCAGPRGRRVSAGALSFLRRVGRESIDRLARQPPPAEVLTEIEEITSEVRRHFLHQELKSYVVMRRILSETGGS